MPKHEGGCLCGKVRCELNDDPEVAYRCHCRFCQKATGIAFRSGMRNRKENVSLNDAELDTYIYTSPEHGQSLVVHFCPSCGTTVTVITNRYPKAQVIMLGTLDDSSSISVDIHMFEDERMT